MAVDRRIRNFAVAGRTAGVRKTPLTGCHVPVTAVRDWVTALGVPAASASTAPVPSIRANSRAPAAGVALHLIQQLKAYCVAGKSVAAVPPAPTVALGATPNCCVTASRSAAPVPVNWSEPEPA